MHNFILTTFISKGVSLREHENSKFNGLTFSKMVGLKLRSAIKHVVGLFHAKIPEIKFARIHK